MAGATLLTFSHVFSKTPISPHRPPRNRPPPPSTTSYCAARSPRPQDYPSSHPPHALHDAPAPAPTRRSPHTTDASWPLHSPSSALLLVRSFVPPSPKQSVSPDSPPPSPAVISLPMDNRENLWTRRSKYVRPRVPARPPSPS